MAEQFNHCLEGLPTHVNLLMDSKSYLLTHLNNLRESDPDSSF